jgi:hypothetical protein
MPYIYNLPVVEEFEHASHQIRLRSYSYDIPGKPLKTMYYATYHRKGASRERGWSKEFPTVEACREFASRRLAEIAAQSLEQSRETRTRRLEAKIAKITRDYLLGRHVGNQLECVICGRKLTDPASIERAIGSECWPRLQDRLAEQVPQCEGTIEKLRSALAAIEEQNFDQMAAWKMRGAHQEQEAIKRRITDAELLLAAARKWKATDERNA